jgi:hypothetical protein
MKIGMLWFDNDLKAELETKVERAADYYRKKYGAAPTVCFVHPSMLTNGKAESSQPPPVEEKRVQVLQATGIKICPNRSVLPNHLWIGLGEKFELQATGS